MRGPGVASCSATGGKRVFADGCQAAGSGSGAASCCRALPSMLCDRETGGKPRMVDYRFHNLKLLERLDAYDAGSCTACFHLSFLRRRSAVTEVALAGSGAGNAGDVLLLLFRSGVCAALHAVTKRLLCHLNASPSDVVRSMYVAGDEVITVSVLPDDNYSSLMCRSIPLSDIRAGNPSRGASLPFGSTPLRWPGYIEFDDLNGVVLWCSAQRRLVVVYDLQGRGASCGSSSSGSGPGDEATGVGGSGGGVQHGAPAPAAAASADDDACGNGDGGGTSAAGAPGFPGFTSRHGRCASSYPLLHSFSSAGLKDVRVASGMLLLVGEAEGTRLPLTLLGARDGAMLAELDWRLDPAAGSLALLDQFHDCLLVQQSTGPLEAVHLPTGQTTTLAELPDGFAAASTTTGGNLACGGGEGGERGGGGGGAGFGESVTRHGCHPGQAKGAAPWRRNAPTFALLHRSGTMLAVMDGCLLQLNSKGEVLSCFDDHPLWASGLGLVAITHDERHIITFTRGAMLPPHPTTAAAVGARGGGGGGGGGGDFGGGGDGGIGEDRRGVLRRWPPRVGPPPVPTISISSISTGRCVARLRAPALQGYGGGLRDPEQRRLQEAIEDVTALYYDEERSQLITGDGSGHVSIWGQGPGPPSMSCATAAAEG